MLLRPFLVAVPALCAIQGGVEAESPFLGRVQHRKAGVLIDETRRDKSQASKLVKHRLTIFAGVTGLTIPRLTIRQRACGSACAADGFVPRLGYDPAIGQLAQKVEDEYQLRQKMAKGRRAARSRFANLFGQRLN